MDSQTSSLNEGGGPDGEVSDWCQDPVDLAVSSPGPPLKTDVSVHNERRFTVPTRSLNPGLRWCEGRWILLITLRHEHRRILKVRLTYRRHYAFLAANALLVTNQMPTSIPNLSLGRNLPADIHNESVTAFQRAQTSTHQSIRGIAMFDMGAGMGSVCFCYETRHLHSYKCARRTWLS